MSPTMRAAVEFTGRNERTLKRWKTAGCNLADKEDLEAWMTKTAQRGRGRAKGQIRATQGKVQRHESGNGNGDTPRLPFASGAGAAAALQRIEHLEALFYGRLQALEGDRPDVVSMALHDYEKTLDALRKFERVVQLGRRDLSQMIPLREVTEGGTALVTCFRLSWRSWLSSATPDLLALADNPLAYKKMAEETFSETIKRMVNAWATAAKPVPEWARKIAIAGFLRDSE
jgi:hypothetical protein